MKQFIIYFSDVYFCKRNTNTLDGNDGKIIRFHAKTKCLFFVLGATVISWMCKNEEHIFVRSVT